METPKLWISVLQVGSLNPEQVARIFSWIRQGDYMINLEFPSAGTCAENRNQIVQRFLKSDFDYLLQIDDDVVPPPDYLDLVDYLEEEDKHIISGVGYAFKADLGDMILPLVLKEKDLEDKKKQKRAKLEKKGEIEDREDLPLEEVELTEKEKEAMDYGLLDIEDDKAGLVKADAVGTGAILTDRKVLKEFMDDSSPPFLNYYDDEGNRKEGLDLAFCRRARERGYDVWAHLDYEYSHMVEMDLKQVHNALLNQSPAE